MFNICVYHSQCPDGLSSAWVAKLSNPFIKFIPCKAGGIPDLDLDDDIDDIKDLKIVFVDICPPYDGFSKIVDNAKFVLVLDHHKTTLDMISEKYQTLPDHLEIVLDMDRSGCQIAWDYFFPKQPRPWFLDYIADRDLWKWQMPNSKVINTALFYNDELNMNVFSELQKASEKEKINELIIKGEIIENIQTKELQLAKSKALYAKMITKFKIYNVWIGNCQQHLRSELGNILAKTPLPNGNMPDFSATWTYDFKSDEWWISLRGVEESPDLTVICKEFGGGGHPRASGFTIPSGKHLKNIFVVQK